MNGFDFRVCVKCMTYNHAPYIVDAMNGFTMQQTTFPFVCTIIDDASTDGEPEVIRQYLRDNFDLEDKSVVRNEDTDDYILTFARHKTNKNCFFAILYLKYNHYGIKKSKAPYIHEWSNTKYIASCEGDDYWIDSEKLQIQVTFLEKNPDFFICSHDYVYYYENKKIFMDKSFNKDFLIEKLQAGSSYYKYSLDNYFTHWFTQPLSCLYRNGEYLKSIPYNRYKYFRDDIFFYYVLKEGYGALLPNVMGVYRINDSGTWSTKDPIDKKRASIYNAYNILMVEGDERAICKMKRLETEVIISHFHTLDLKELLCDIGMYFKMVPFKHAVFFVFYLMKRAVLGLLKRGENFITNRLITC